MLKQKFKSAEHARLHRELTDSWEHIVKKYSASNIKKTKVEKLTAETHKTNKYDIPSKVTAGGSTSLKASIMYTGTKMLGVAVLHKSNAIPVFTNDEIIDVARMRR